jgi:hypothetical protein
MISIPGGEGAEEKNGDRRDLFLRSFEKFASEAVRAAAAGHHFTV